MPGTFVLLGTSLLAGIACGGAGIVLGSLAALANRSRDCISQAATKGLNLGSNVGAVIGAPPALITSAAASVASFSVITPLLTALNFPRFIYQAATRSNSEVIAWEQKSEIRSRSTQDCRKALKEEAYLGFGIALRLIPNGESCSSVGPPVPQSVISQH